MLGYAFEKSKVWPIEVKIFSFHFVKVNAANRNLQHTYYSHMVNNNYESSEFLHLTRISFAMSHER
mgnify:CR=1 FL=1